MSSAPSSRKTGFSHWGGSVGGYERGLGRCASRVPVVWCRRLWKVDVDRRTLAIERYR